MTRSRSHSVFCSLVFLVLSFSRTLSRALSLAYTRSHTLSPWLTHILASAQQHSQDECVCERESVCQGFVIFMSFTRSFDRAFSLPHTLSRARSLSLFPALSLSRYLSHTCSLAHSLPVLLSRSFSRESSVSLSPTHTHKRCPALSLFLAQTHARSCALSLTYTNHQRKMVSPSTGLAVASCLAELQLLGRLGA